VRTSGVNAFLVLTTVSNDERGVQQTDAIRHGRTFGLYVVGVLIMAALAVAGWLLFQAGDRPAAANQS
jgi:hypothetical protein